MQWLSVIIVIGHIIDIGFFVRERQIQHCLYTDWEQDCGTVENAGWCFIVSCTFRTANNRDVLS